MSTKFIRKKEDFVCEHCGYKVKGTGYTNHCPKCLWSRHVDVNPGDRKEECRGMMEPVGIETKGEKFVIIQKCVKCGVERKNKTDKNDDFERILQISRSQY